MIYNKNIAENACDNLLRLLEPHGIDACVKSGYEPLSNYVSFESKKAREIGHTDAIRLSVGDFGSAEIFVLEDGTLCTGSTFMSLDAISYIIWEFTELNAPYPDVFWENGVKTYSDPHDDENGVIFTTIGKLREWFGRWEWREVEIF